MRLDKELNPIVMEMTKKEKEHIRNLIKVIRNHEYKEAICIEFAKIVHGSYSKAPWSGWHGLGRFYPIFSRYKAPRGSIYNPVTRKKVIESLAAKINKKKDPYRGSSIFKKGS